jgi:hypothetical protein
LDAEAGRRLPLVELNRAGGHADVTTLGDSFLLKQDFKAASRSEVAGVFGREFAAQSSWVEIGVWQGPVTSGYGVHLVFVHERTEGHLPPLDEVRDAVRREWANAQRLEADEKFSQRPRERYSVRVEQPEKADGSSAVAAEVRR